MAYFNRLNLKLLYHKLKLARMIMLLVVYCYFSIYQSIGKLAISQYEIMSKYFFYSKKFTTIIIIGKYCHVMKKKTVNNRINYFYLLKHPFEYKKRTQKSNKL